MRRNVAYRMVFLLGAVALAVAAAPGSAGPVAAKGWRAPVLVSKTQAHRETSLALNPKDPKELFLCDPSGVPAIETGQSYFHRSVDGGAKWRPVAVETADGDTRSYAFEGGDCDVAYDAGGTMWSADTWVGNLSIGHSRNGRSWEGTALATTAPVVDRPWLVGGKPGTLYVAYQDLQCCVPSAMWFTKTTDYGKSFAPAVPITTGDQNGGFTWEGNLVVAPGGEDLYLVYSRRVGGVVDPGRPELIALAYSRDGGATWASRPIATIPRETSTIYPSIGLDAGGQLHVVWAAPRADDNPVFYTTSKNRGATWTKPVPLNPGKTGQAPWVAGGKKGQARVAWLGSPQTGTPDVETPWYFYVARIDPGRKPAVGTTTRGPVWEGKQTVPEFEMVRLDRQGKMHLGMSVFQGDPGKQQWAVFYQREI